LSSAASLKLFLNLLTYKSECVCVGRNVEEMLKVRGEEVKRYSSGDDVSGLVEVT